MSFAKALDGRLARDLWPEGTYSEDVFATSDKAMDIWLEVPHDFVELCDWAYVGRNEAATDRSRSKLLLYTHVTAANKVHTLYPVSVRIQGFLQEFNLATLGDWRGDPARAAGAHQSLVLSSGGFTEPWKVNHAMIHNFRHLIIQTLRGSFDEPVNDGNISVQRRVFTRVSNTNRDIPSILSVADDPLGKASSIGKNWRITERLQIGRLLPDGKTAACSPLALNRGDFVDVCVGFEIVEHSKQGISTLRVRLEILHVLQLRAAVAPRGDTAMAEKPATLEYSRLTFE